MKKKLEKWESALANATSGLYIISETHGETLIEDVKQAAQMIAEYLDDIRTDIMEVWCKIQEK